MERHNIWRANGGRRTARHRWEGCTERRFRPATAPVAFDRPRCEQTWPVPLDGRRTPPPMVADDAHPQWPGRPRPAVPCYQRRLDRHTDGIVRSLRVQREVRAVTGRRRSLSTHRRPVALVGGPMPIGRGTDAHDTALFGARPLTYRRMRVDLDPGAAFAALLRDLRAATMPSPRRAAIATIAVVVIVMSTVSAGFA